MSVGEVILVVVLAAVVLVAASTVGHLMWRGMGPLPVSGQGASGGTEAGPDPAARSGRHRSWHGEGRSMVLLLVAFLGLTGATLGLIVVGPELGLWAYWAMVGAVVLVWGAGLFVHSHAGGPRSGDPS